MSTHDLMYYSASKRRWYALEEMVYPHLVNTRDRVKRAIAAKEQIMDDDGKPQDLTRLLPMLEAEIAARPEPEAENG